MLLEKVDPQCWRPESWWSDWDRLELSCVNWWGMVTNGLSHGGGVWCDRMVDSWLSELLKCGSGLSELLKRRSKIIELLICRSEMIGLPKCRLGLSGLFRCRSEIIELLMCRSEIIGLLMEEC